MVQVGADGGGAVLGQQRDVGGTQRGSPDSTMRPTWVLVFSRISGGAVHRPGEQQRRDRHPGRSRGCSTVRGQHDEARARLDRGADLGADLGRRRAAGVPMPPPCCSDRTGRRSRGLPTKPGREVPSSLTCTSLARSCSPMTGNGSTICRQDAGPGSSRFCSGPVEVDSEVTSSSRIASSGGLRSAWANSCVK